MGQRRAIVHIGTHKTGSTSLQYWLAQNAQHLESRYGFGVYRPIHPNGRELALWCANPDRQIPTIREIPEWQSHKWRTESFGHMRSEIERDTDTLVASNETLCLLRTNDELERLRELFSPRHIEIVLVTRRPDEFLRSWREQLTRDGFSESNDPSSFAYLASDSWLVDYEEILRVYRRVFGDDQVHHVDYDAALARDSSIIPAVMAHVVGDTHDLPDWRDVRRNRGSRPHPNESPSVWRRVARRLRSRLDN